MNHPEIIIVPSFFFMVGYICWLWTSAVQRKQRLTLLTDFNGKLLDKLMQRPSFADTRPPAA